MLIAVFSVAFLVGSLMVSWALSYFTSILYDNFMNIAKYYSFSLTTEYRFKIIGFIKRLGGRPFGLSMWGFFYIKRNFLIKASFNNCKIAVSGLNCSAVINTM
ncbi:uncharacterized protein LOC111614035 [Centruroides sculpturatus]|uniref:uncharacterized protein LOC111614035 n=1 Tax=Centruroides sculpturatus TaxID=218467 RepID=UPI000C6EF53E|nr:uncharacterized protein LOC111614035 [Centruroides sculpturatus]